MENWRRYLKELNLDPTMGTTDTANVVYTSRALSNQQKQRYNKAQRELAKGNIPPETIEKVKKAAKQAWQNFGYNQFAELWNNTVGYILPELPRTDQDGAGIAVDIGYMILEIVGYFFGYAALLKGWKFIKNIIIPIIKAMKKNKKLENLFDSAENIKKAIPGILQTTREKITAGGEEFIKQFQQNAELAMNRILGAV